MAFLPNISEQLFSSATASLANASEIDSGWLDLEQYASYQISVFAGDSNLDLVIDSSESSGGGGVNDIQSTTVLLQSFLSTLPCRERNIRIRVQNNTGSAIANVKFEVVGLFIGTGASVFPDYVNPATFSPALLVQAVLKGLDTESNYRSVGVNTAGAILTSDFGTEVARRLYEDEGWSISTKFGRNPDIDTGSTPEDMWAGGGEYTGFNATANENIFVDATGAGSANQNGVELSNGTSTGGSEFTLIDSLATFITDGTVVGDLLINDTKSAHGFITSIDSETQITVLRMTNGDIEQVANQSGDSYRIVDRSAGGTGAQVVRLEQILNEDYESQEPKYVIMNGGANVTVTVDAIRCSRAKVIMAGSDGTNSSTIRVRQATTTANIFAQVPTTGQTTIAAFTVPIGKIMLIKRIRVSITRANGSAGSATVLLNARERDGAWRAVRVFEIQTGAPTEFSAEGGITFLEGSDIKYTISNVSDNNTVVDGAFEYYLIDES